MKHRIKLNFLIKDPPKEPFTVPCRIEGDKKNQYWSIYLIPLEKTGIWEGNLFSDKAPNELLKKNTQITLFEGTTPIGTGEIQ
ncbi:hypothetical protein GF420_15620 [candidate division GN15 bacterium]|nr:hypothetical protein [candidate division GN15 bacterium]